MQIQRRGDDPRVWKLYRGNGSIEVEWYFRPTTRLGANVMLYHLEPGVEEGLHHHGEDEQACSPTSDEIYVVTKGEIVLITDDGEQLLREGDGAYVQHGEHHGVRNASAHPAELVLIFGRPKPAETAA